MNNGFGVMSDGLVLQAAILVLQVTSLVLPIPFRLHHHQASLRLTQRGLGQGERCLCLVRLLLQVREPGLGLQRSWC